MAHVPGHQRNFSALGQNPAFQQAIAQQQQQASLVNQPLQQAPPTGLIGSEQAIQQGLSGQLGLLAQGIGSAQGEIDLATQQARGDIT